MLRDNVKDIEDSHEKTKAKSSMRALSIAALVSLVFMAPALVIQLVIFSLSQCNNMTYGGVNVKCLAEQKNHV